MLDKNALMQISFRSLILISIFNQIKLRKEIYQQVKNNILQIEKKKNHKVAFI